MEKEQKKNETKEKKPLTEQQRLQRKKMLVYPLMGLLFLGRMWLTSHRPPRTGRRRSRVRDSTRTCPCPKTRKSSVTRRKPTSSCSWRTGRKNAGAWWATCPRSGTTARKSRTRRLHRTTTPDATEPSENERADKQQAAYAPPLPPTSG